MIPSMLYNNFYFNYCYYYSTTTIATTSTVTSTPTTTHSAIAYLDRLQPNERFSRFEWQMLAICCLLISAKYNECEEHVPSLKSLEEITQQKIVVEVVVKVLVVAIVVVE